MEAEVRVQPPLGGPATAEQPSDDRHSKRQKEHKAHKEKKAHKERKEPKEHKSRRDKRHSSDAKHGKDRAPKENGHRKQDGLESGEIEDMVEKGPCVSSETTAPKPLPPKSGAADGTDCVDANAPSSHHPQQPGSPGPALPGPPQLPGPPPRADGQSAPLPGPPERPSAFCGQQSDASGPDSTTPGAPDVATASDPAVQHAADGDAAPSTGGARRGDRELTRSGRDSADPAASPKPRARGDSIDGSRSQRVPDARDDRRRERDADGASRRDAAPPTDRRRSASKDRERDRDRGRERVSGGRYERDHGAADRSADAARRRSGSRDRDRERDRDRYRERDRDRDWGRDRDRGRAERGGGRVGGDRRDGYVDRRREPSDYDTGRDRRLDDRYSRDAHHSGRPYDRHGGGRQEPDRHRGRDDRGDRRPDGERSREQPSSKRKRDEVDEADVMAEFEEMMTEEEREQQELEARRRRLAEINAKLERERREKQAATQPAADPEATAAPPPQPPSDGAAAPQASLPAAVAPPAPHPSALPQHALVNDEGPTNPPADDADAALRAWHARAEDDDGVEACALFQRPSEPAAPAAKGGGGGDGGGGGIDIFASDDEEEEAGAMQNVKGVAETIEDDDRATVKQAAGCKRTNTGLSDMYDDSQGYYNFRVGEIMDGRYEVIKASGKGVFSSVVKARDKLRQDASGVNPEVAIKLIRANDVMHKAGKLEQQILDKLASTDPENRKHIVRLLRSFEYRNHLCLVFENMEMNLRELTRKVGVGRGIKIEAVGNFALQMLIALRHLRDNNVLHADIKPDNILINDRLNKIKLCDLGSAMFAGGNEPTPYLVSRFYRAPEVILGLPYDFPMDMWSIAAAIYELFTADILFKGRNNNEMLKLMMDLKGPFPKKMIRKGLFSSQHFADDPNMSFISMETDVVSKEPVKRLVANPEKKRTFLQLLTRAAAKEHMGQKVPKEEMRRVEMLADFLERCTALDPAARMTPSEAIQHRFIQAVIAAATKNSKKAKGGK